MNTFTTICKTAALARAYNNMYAREEKLILWVENVGLTSLPNSHRVVLDAFDDILVIEEQFRMVVALVKDFNKVKFGWCEMEQVGKEMNDSSLGFLKVKAFLFLKYGNEGCTDMAVLYGLNVLEIIEGLWLLTSAYGKVKKNGLSQCFMLLVWYDILANHAVNIIKIPTGTTLNERFYLTAKQFNRTKSVDCELPKKGDCYMPFFCGEDMTSHGIVDFYLDIVAIASCIDVGEYPGTERMRSFCGWRDGVALRDHIWNDDAVYPLAFLKHFVAAAIITVVKVNVNRKAWHLEYSKVDGSAAFQDKALLEKCMTLNELENICKTKDFLEIVTKEACLRGKSRKLLTVVCWHNLKMLNVVVDLRGNVKAPFVDERRALFQGCKTGDAAVAMAAAGREEFIWKMQRVCKKRHDIAYFLIQSDFSVIIQIKKQMFSVDILDGRETVQQFLNTAAKINSVNAVDDGTFDICYADGAIVVKRENALGNGITKVSVTDTVEIKRREAGVADNGHLVKRLMRKSMIFHCRMVGHGCRRSYGSGYLDLGSLRRRGGKVQHTIEVTPHFGDEATGLVVEQKLCSTFPTSRYLHNVFLGEYEFPLQFW